MNRDQQQVSRGHMPYGVSCAVGESRGVIVSMGRKLGGILFLKDRNMGCKTPDLSVPVLGNRATLAGIHAAKVNYDGQSVGDLNQHYANQGIDVPKGCKCGTHKGVGVDSSCNTLPFLDCVTLNPLPCRVLGPALPEWGLSRLTRQGDTD